MAGNKSSSSTKIILLIVVITVAVIGLFWARFGRGASTHEASTTEEETVLSAVTEITTMNLDVNYPAAERDVVKTFGQIEKVLYNEEYTDDQFKVMAEKLMALYDEELLATQEDYVSALRAEADSKKADGYTIQNIAVADKSTITYDQIDGRSCALIECLFSVRKESKLTTIDYQFILRKDDAGKWKILGFTPKVAEE